jgi:hypothetical protein
MRFLVIGLLYLLGTTISWAEDHEFREVDYAKCERHIGKEPKYIAQPLYALFVLDPRGKVRSWAVLDKSSVDSPHYDVLYFDLNGNGDLTEPQKRFTAKYSKDGEPAGLAIAFRVGDFRVPGTNLVHKNLLFATVPKAGRKGIWFQMNWDGKTEVSGGYARAGYDNTQYGTSLADAPILRPTPLGPLTVGIWGDAHVTLPTGGAANVNFIVGSWGSGPDTLCVVDEHFLVPGKDRLLATVIAKDKTGKEVRAQSEIKQHC